MGWTPETVLHYCQQEFACQRDQVVRAMEASTTASEKAERNLQIRLEGMNEWRATVTDLIQNKVDRREWTLAEQGLARDVEQLRLRLEQHVSSSLGNTAAWGRVLAISGTVAAVSGAISGALVAILHYLNSAGR